MQLFDDGPLQVLHDGEQVAHFSPVLYDPSGHGVITPFGTAGNGLHFVSSFGSWVKPFSQARQVAVSSAHSEHPI